MGELANFLPSLGELLGEVLGELLLTVPLRLMEGE
jgi:hypothetical protein